MKTQHLFTSLLGIALLSLSCNRRIKETFSLYQSFVENESMIDSLDQGLAVGKRGKFYRIDFERDRIVHLFTGEYEGDWVRFWFMGFHPDSAQNFSFDRGEVWQKYYADFIDLEDRVVQETILEEAYRAASVHYHLKARFITWTSQGIKFRVYQEEYFLYRRLGDRELPEGCIHLRPPWCYCNKDLEPEELQKVKEQFEKYEKRSVR
ncbi:MAG: hypothetical protein AAFP89_17900 [Bacteroidota bacterium]